MKIHHTLVVALALLAPLGMAQAASGGKSNPGMHQGMMKDCDEMEDCMTEGLNLTQDQQQKIRSIVDNARQQRQQLRDQTYQQIKDVLTPEQQKKLEAHHAEMKRWRDEHMKNRAEHMKNRSERMQQRQQNPGGGMGGGMGSGMGDGMNNGMGPGSSAPATPNP